MVRIGKSALVPAKIDTGADSTAVWASEIEVADGKLSFVLFAPESEFFTGEKLEFTEFSVVKLRSSFGDLQVRYVVEMAIEIAGERVMTRVGLANRSKNRYPVLIGRKTLAGRFLVDVARRNVPEQGGGRVKERGLRAELDENPDEFHQKYFKEEK